MINKKIKRQKGIKRRKQQQTDNARRDRGKVSVEIGRKKGNDGRGRKKVSKKKLNERNVGRERK